MHHLVVQFLHMLIYDADWMSTIQFDPISKSSRTDDSTTIREIWTLFLKWYIWNQLNSQQLLSQPNSKWVVQYFLVLPRSNDTFDWSYSIVDFELQILLPFVNIILLTILGLLHPFSNHGNFSPLALKSYLDSTSDDLQTLSNKLAIYTVFPWSSKIKNTSLHISPKCG